MKPLRLRMQAFGPYAKVVRIDFRSLANGGLFLIHGQTGAGKTSVLDGLCFALFGTSSGADRSGESLRCDLAKADLATEVTLEFALGPEIYRVTRRPAQTLAKKRGEGTTQQKPSGDLFKLEGSSIDADESAWRLLTNGAQKTDARVTELLGMSEAQFRQVVVLPQGQFRKFLSATSDARESLLATLFRTEKFKRLADFFGERAKAIESEVSAKRSALEALLGSFEVTDAASLAESAQQVKVKIEHLRQGENELEERYRQAAERLDQSRKIAKAASDLTICEERERSLAASKPELDLLNQALENERRSRPVLAADLQVQSLERDLARLRGDERQEREKLATAIRALDAARSAQREADAIRARMEEMKSERDRLRDVWKHAEALQKEKDLWPEAVRRLQEAERKILVSAQALEKQRLENSTLEKRAAELTALVQAAQATRAERDLKVADKRALDNEVAELNKATVRFDECEKARQLSVDALANARERLARLMLDHHLSQAARLARELKDGRPCPVCGSRDHPQPAMVSAHGESDAATGPSEANLEEARSHELAASAQVAASQAKSDAARDEIARIKARLAGRFGAEPDLVPRALSALHLLDAAIRDDDTKITRANESEKELRSLRQRQATIEAEIKTAEAEALTRQTARDQARSQLDSSRATIAQLESIVALEFRDLTALKTRGQVLSETIGKFETEIRVVAESLNTATRAEASSQGNLESLGRQIQDKEKSLTSQLEMRDRVLHSSGFVSLEACRAAHMDSARVEVAEKRRREFDAEWAIVHNRLAELKAELAAAPPWALQFEERAKEFQEIDTVRAQRRAELLSLQERADVLGRAGQRAIDSTNEIAALEGRYQIIGKLAGVALGQPPHNHTRVNFQRYVLAARLDEVLEQASHRLYQMSRGQFLLKRATAQEDKRRSAGLELEVEDAFSGSSRPTSSLSGGEGFMASLCLALGLADVVQSRLGGVRLEAVFVDEGFGTLDSETLDLAMKTLAELQAGGRIVGIISHVPELKEQVSRRLVVTKTPDGSDATWDTPSSLAL